jgi:hypothetical protein
VYLPIEYIPLLLWAVYLVYFFFPNEASFNPKGRVYFYSILKSLFLSPFVDISFMLTFATDQSTSFVTSINDFFYTMCFYGSDFTVGDVSSCLKAGSFNGILVSYAGAMVPQIFRLIQCYRYARKNAGSMVGVI